MDELRQRVSQYIYLPKKQSTGIMILSKFNIQSPFIYAVPPIIILIILVLIKPSFITNEHINKNNDTVKKINYSYLIITTLIFGILIDIGLFTYIRKINK